MSKGTWIILAIILTVIVLIICGCFAFFYYLANSVSEAQSSDFSNEYSEEIIVDGGGDKIVVIDIKGIIVDSDVSTDFWGNSFAATGQITTELENAKNDSSVKAIILDINSPGGGVYASDVIYEKILEVKEKKPVIALMRDTAASGGYYVAAPADKIVADELTITGSIGVIVEFISFEGLYEKAGIEGKTITNTGGDFKAGEGLFDENPNGEDEKIIQRLVDESYEKFVSIVAEGRGMSKEDVKKLADGRIYSGLQAKENNLIDELGKFDKAVEIAGYEAGIEKPTVIRYQKLDFWSLLTQAKTFFSNPVVEIFKNQDITPGMKLQYLMQ